MLIFNKKDTYLLKNSLILFIYSSVFAGYYSDLEADFHSFFKEKNFCTLCDCDGVLTNPKMRESWNMKDLSQNRAFYIPCFLKKFIIPRQKMIAFFSAFHDQNDDISSLQNTMNVIKGVFLDLGLEDPCFGPLIQTKTKESTGYISWSEKFPFIHLLAIRPHYRNFFTEKTKAKEFHQIFFQKEPTKFAYLPDSYMFIDDCIEKFISLTPYHLDYQFQFSELPDPVFFGYNQYGKRAFNVAEKIATFVLPKEKRESEVFSETLLKKIDQSFLPKKNFFYKNNLILHLNDLFDFCQKTGIKHLILPGKSPQYLRYFIDLLQSDRLENIFKELMPSQLNFIGSVKKKAQGIQCLSLPFSGVPQSQKETHSTGPYNKNSIHQDKEGNVDVHRSLSANLYTPEGMHVMLEELKKKTSSIPVGARVLVMDVVGGGGGIGTFMSFLKQAYPSLDVCAGILNHWGVLEITDHFENFCLIDGVMSAKSIQLKSFDDFQLAITFHLERISPSYSSLCLVPSIFFPFPAPFDLPILYIFSDIVSFLPCDWEWGSDPAIESQCIKEFKKTLPLLSLVNWQNYDSDFDVYHRMPLLQDWFQILRMGKAPEKEWPESLKEVFANEKQIYRSGNPLVKKIMNDLESNISSELLDQAKENAELFEKLDDDVFSKIHLLSQKMKKITFQTRQLQKLHETELEKIEKEAPHEIKIFQEGWPRQLNFSHCFGMNLQTYTLNLTGLEGHVKKTVDVSKDFVQNDACFVLEQKGLTTAGFLQTNNNLELFQNDSMDEERGEDQSFEKQKSQEDWERQDFSDQIMIEVEGGDLNKMSLGLSDRFSEERGQM
jgi:hypothetical protein